MKQNKKIIILISTIVFSQLFTFNKASAKSLLINYDLTEGVNVTDKPTGEEGMKIIGGIDYPEAYEIKGEKGDCFEIDYKGKKAYTEKSWFHVLEDTKVLKNTKIYEKADTKSKEISKVKKGEKIVLLAFDSDKKYIKVKNGDKIGYTKLEDFDLSKKKKKDLEKLEIKYIKINGSVKRYLDYLKRNNLSLYPIDENKESAQSEINRSYPDDYEDETLEDNDNSKDVEYVYYTVDGDDIGSQAYNFATKFIGNPYVFGGTNLTNGIDCSGFTQQVYAQFGISLPHFAQSQADYGKSINIGEEEAGDLVFFGTSLSNITHVAIADGQGGIVHAANPRDGIITSSIGNPLLIKRLVED